MFPVDKKRLGDKKVLFNNVLIPWYPVSYLKIASSGFFFLGAYGSLPDAAIRVILNYFFCVWRTPGVRSCAPHASLMCARLGADGYLRFSLVS